MGKKTLLKWTDPKTLKTNSSFFTGPTSTKSIKYNQFYATSKTNRQTKEIKFNYNRL